MSVLAVTDDLPPPAVEAFLLGARFAKQADDAEVAYNLTGTLVLAGNGWLLLSVPNALALGIFHAMDEPGIELPPSPGGKFNAHISVMRPEEVARVGDVKERGKQFYYTLGRFYAAEPAGWKDVAKVWFVRVHSPELQELRRSYGLSGLPNDGKYDFHITVGVVKRGVLGRNEKRRATGPVEA